MKAGVGAKAKEIVLEDSVGQKQTYLLSSAVLPSPSPLGYCLWSNLSLESHMKFVLKSVIWSR